MTQSIENALAVSELPWTVDWTSLQGDREVRICGWSLGKGLPAYESRIAVLLHGAGRASSSRLTGMARDFVRLGVPVFAFDFPGHGMSSGSLADSSLRERQEIALFIIKHLLPEAAELILVGFSMSAHTVISISEILRRRVAALGLMCPAVYAEAAEDLVFGRGFTAEIRRPRSWSGSRAFASVRGFSGRVLMVVGTQDMVIPGGVVMGLLNSLRDRVSSSRVELLGGVGHQLAVALDEQPGLRARIVAYLVAG